MKPNRVHMFMAVKPVMHITTHAGHAKNFASSMYATFISACPCLFSQVVQGSTKSCRTPAPLLGTVTWVLTAL